MRGKQMIRKGCAVLLSIGVLASGSLSSGNYTFAAEQSVKNAYTKYSADVTGDKNLETIYVGMDSDAEGVFIKVQDSKTKKILMSTATDYYGADYDTELSFQDFNGDNKKEIVLSAGSGGSSGDHVCAVYTVIGGKLKAIPIKQADLKAEVKITEKGTYLVVKPTFSKTSKSVKVNTKYYQSIDAGDVTGQYQGPSYTLKDINKDKKAELIESFDYYLINHGDGLGSCSIYYQYSSKQKALVAIGFVVE